MDTTSPDGAAPADLPGDGSGAERRVAVIGLGAMGGAMAATLHRAGWAVTGVDPSPEARARAADAGLATADRLEDVAGTPSVVLSLPSARVVEQAVPVLLEREGTRVVLDTTTSEPATSEAMAAAARERGAVFVDAPVSGGASGAATGALSAFVGGTAEDVRAAEPLLAALTGGQYAVVGGTGAGNVVKLLNNVLCATNLIAVGEAMDVAAAHGLDLATVAQAVSGASGGSAVTANVLPRWVLSGTFDSGFALGLMARDVGLALDVAAARGAKPSLLAATHDAWQRALAERGPAADFTEAPATAATATTALAPADPGASSTTSTEDDR
ncbi:NAD(P)-dependent oxidoreductase [Pseudokineococcus sp. 1T1Z-3]|uniref:NAD(P)-dependent oxidoreductase n=1 Tax=Pseudokineococcus sp. 1T1Z-3 TaxID=3132745 RepID=UPI0030AD86DF